MPSFLLVPLLLAAAATATPTPSPSPSPSPSATPPAMDMGGMDMSSMPGMNTSGGDDMAALMRMPLGLPMERDASGTSWQPDTSPHFGRHLMAGKWMLMIHGLAMTGYDQQQGPRGGHETTSVNWLMLMASRPAAGGRIGARLMLSGEPLTVTGGGYPLLLQTGETYHGQVLHDRQHPHDLFMEAALHYERELGQKLGMQLYLAPSGEPALGPPAFPHRISAMSDPFAPLGHHWQDSTHVSFGVATLGFFTKWAKLEGSWFNGREPDENRWDFDFRTPDSGAARLSLMPDPSLTLQASYGFLKSPEALEPRVSQRRTTVSAIWDRPIGDGGNLAVTGVWGRVQPEDAPLSDSFLLEANVDLNGRDTVFGRVENLRKSAADLVLPASVAAPDATFQLDAFSAGYVHDFGAVEGVVPGLGFVATESFLPGELTPAYGSTDPIGWMVYLRLRPTRSHGMGGGM